MSHLFSVYIYIYKNDVKILKYFYIYMNNISDTLQFFFSSVVFLQDIDKYGSPQFPVFVPLNKFWYFFLS